MIEAKKRHKGFLEHALLPRNDLGDMTWRHASPGDTRLRPAHRTDRSRLFKRIQQFNG